MEELERVMSTTTVARTDDSSVTAIATSSESSSAPLKLEPLICGLGLEIPEDYSRVGELLYALPWELRGKHLMKKHLPDL